MDSEDIADALYGNTKNASPPPLADDGFSSRPTPEQQARLDVIYDGNSVAPHRVVVLEERTEAGGGRDGQ